MEPVSPSSSHTRSCRKPGRHTTRVDVTLLLRRAREAERSIQLSLYPCGLHACAFFLPLIPSHSLLSMAQGVPPPGLVLNGATVPTMDSQPTVSSFGEPQDAGAERPKAKRVDTNYTMASMMSVPPEGSILTGKQEHCKQRSST